VNHAIPEETPQHQKPGSIESNHLSYSYISSLIAYNKKKKGTREKCSCGFRIRGKNHFIGQHHGGKKR
jgi:hypothetical protein